jgi:hypothetical protein
MILSLFFHPLLLPLVVRSGIFLDFLLSLLLCCWLSSWCWCYPTFDAGILPFLSFCWITFIVAPTVLLDHLLLRCGTLLPLIMLLDFLNALVTACCCGSPLPSFCCSGIPFLSLCCCISFAVSMKGTCGITIFYEKLNAAPSTFHGRNILPGLRQKHPPLSWTTIRPPTPPSLLRVDSVTIILPIDTYQLGLQ